MEETSKAGPEAESSLLAWIEVQQVQLWRYLRLLGASPTDAEDIVQDTFLRVLARRRDEPLEATTPLLRVVARNLFIDGIRTERRRRVLAWSNEVEEWLSCQPEVLSDDRIDALRRCLATLTKRVRAALLARHVDGLSLQQVATQAGIQLEGARAMLRRAREQLRACTNRLARRQEGER